MQIQVYPKIITLPELKTVRSLFTLRVCSSNEKKPKQLEPWVPSFHAKTIMGVVDGSYHGYITEEYDYLGRHTYSIIRLARDV